MTIRNSSAGSPAISPARTSGATTAPASSTMAASVMRSPAGASGSKASSTPATCGNCPATSGSAETPNSSTATRSARVRVSSVSPLLKASVVWMSFWLMPPSGLKTSPCASVSAGLGERTASAPPGGTTVSPMEARMPPPFLIETTTASSASRAAARLASAVRLPRLVSCVRTPSGSSAAPVPERLPFRNTSEVPKTLDSAASICAPMASAMAWTSGSTSSAAPRSATPCASVA